jgi:hypothetical protein
LILQAKKPGDADEDAKNLQVIPRSILRDDFPTSLIDNYVHWLDLSTGELEFCPAGSPWTHETSNWRLRICEHPRVVLQKPHQSVSLSPIQLIDIRSRTFGVLSKLLAPLEFSEHIVATFTAARTVEVSLPRFHLLFFVNTNWALECRSIPGYAIDKNQTCGTMFGLKNKLILCPDDDRLPRRVIIPEGNVSFGRNGDFTRVSIDTGSGQHVPWHEYTIDTGLQCLTNHTSLRGKLHLCYLHALTSHCLPDPLLGHTGTEEALYILQSASCRSFQRLDDRDAALLNLIRGLTPHRYYYPYGQRSMARVSWKDLPALSQHHGFVQIISSILVHANSLEALYDQPTKFYPSSSDVLLNRVASRNKSYYPSDTQILQRSLSPDDVVYKSRDVSGLGAIENVAFRTSWSIWNGRPSLEGGLQNLWDIMNSWGSVGPADCDSGLVLGYSHHWLKFDAARDWFVIYDLCRNAINGRSKKSRIQLCFGLSAAAYGESNYSGIVPFLVIFSLDESFSRLNPPSDGSYVLSDDVAPDFALLKSVVFDSKLPIESTPAHALPSSYDEYNNTIQRESSRAAETLLRLWPRYQYEGLPEEWFDRRDFNRRIEESVQPLLRNVRLKNHAEQLESVLQKYRDVGIPFPAPYILPPQSITGHSKAPSYSLHDVLISRANVPTPSAERKPSLRGSISSREAAEPSPPAKSDSLKSLIEEFRNSRQPLQRDYGDELDKSYSKLLSQDASQLARDAIPSHEHLVSYHNECSRRKDCEFSEISACLMPLPHEGETNSVAGLWPRITPRSLLRQLARDRINELPDKWRSVFMRYAIALLRYRHSIRLLELSLRQRHEELARELDAIHNELLAESNPDWLLVQVGPIR